MKVFASEISKCRVWKAIYGWIAVIFAIILFIGVPVAYFLNTPVEKRDIDFAKEYVLLRMNFTPDKVGNAYHNPLQYQFPLYDTVIKDEVDFVVSKQIYQVFGFSSLYKDSQTGKFIAQGRLVKFSCIDSCSKVYDRFVKVVFTQPKPRTYKFLIEEIKETY